MAERPEVQRDRKVAPWDTSIGGWCLVNPGVDPFGGPVRDWKLDDGLIACAETGITGVSFHDRDAWADDAPQEERSRVIQALQKRLAELGLKPICFTTNLFSNACFRSGAFTSPRPEVRRAAIVKACRALDDAAELGVINFIFWGGREGTEVGEQDPGIAAELYILSVRLCVMYALEKGYPFRFTIEPKIYEPRFDLYLGTGGAVAAAILHYFPEKELRGRIGINPEMPQHDMISNLNPWLSLGQLLRMDLIGAVIHFGGQVAGRMDADFGPGIGRTNYFDDFKMIETLHLHNWRGYVEFDCRPLRTTTAREGLRKFLAGSVRYLRTLERKLQTFLDDPVVKQLQHEIFGDENAKNDIEMVMACATRNLLPIKKYGYRFGVVDAVAQLAKGFPGFAVIATVKTDAIEELNRRTQQIIMGDA